MAERRVGTEFEREARLVAIERVADEHEDVGSERADECLAHRLQVGVLCLVATLVHQKIYDLVLCAAIL